MIRKFNASPGHQYQDKAAQLMLGFFDFKGYS